jgi:hypothetical protein
MLAELLDGLAKMAPPQRAAAAQAIMEGTKQLRFVPLPGPQTDAYRCRADLLLYGGSAGSAKSALLVGLAVNEHTKSIIFRRESSQTDGLEAFGKEVIGTTASYNGTDHEWTWPEGGRTLKLAGMKEPGDWTKHAGRERDFIGFDEGAEFLESQVSSMLAWLRAEPGKRCRVVLASNPPRSAEGAWMIEWFAPWLDPKHPNPAAPGELRWCLMWRGQTIWVEGPGEHEVDGETVLAMSRTFIPASLKDNPYRDTPEYRARLQSLEEPLRSQLLYGDFGAGAEDDAWQAIPTAWVRAAQQRWTATPPVGIPLCAMGVDVAQGGGDDTVIAKRHDSWYAPLIVEPGTNTPGGTDVAALVIKHRHDAAKPIVDVGGGWGADAHGHLMRNNVDSVAYMGVKATTKRSKDNVYRFTNTRSWAFWTFREALNPDQRGGSQLALPPDREMLVDLTTPRYRVKNAGTNGAEIEIESKEKVCARLGRSPNKGDAVLMAWTDGAKMATHYEDWSDRQGSFGKPAPRVIMRRQPLTAR